MKKTPYLLATLSAFLLAGCSVQQFTGSSQTPSSDSVQKQVIDKASDAVSAVAGKKKCTFKESENSPFTSTLYVDGIKSSSITSINGDVTHSVFDGTTAYTWSDKDKKGTKMSIECLKDLAGQFEKSGVINKDEILKESKNLENPLEDKNNVQCEPTDKVDLTIPSDIQFDDQCEIMKNQAKMLDKVKGAIPKGIKLPENIQ